MPKKVVAEFLGTALLVYFAVGVATLSFGFGPAGTSGASLASGIVATALAFGLVLAVLAYAIGPISGCHVNPAVTLAAWLSGRMSLDEAGQYWGAQFAGGIAGALALWGTFVASPIYNRSTTGLGADGYGSNSIVHISAWGAFIVEAIMTALFVFVILAVTRRGFAANAVLTGLVIGLSLTVVHLIGIPLTGTSVNPARALGPAIVVGGSHLKQVWLFILAPLVGGGLAAGLYLFFYGREPDEEAEPDEPTDDVPGLAEPDDSETVDEGEEGESEPVAAPDAGVAADAAPAVDG
jgi:aquaporin Z